jgi:hypothetical protein
MMPSIAKWRAQQRHHHNRLEAGMYSRIPHRSRRSHRIHQAARKHGHEQIGNRRQRHAQRRSRHHRPLAPPVLEKKRQHIAHRIFSLHGFGHSDKLTLFELKTIGAADRLRTQVSWIAGGRARKLSGRK